MRIVGNFFDNNGKGSAGTGAVEILNSANITICGNTFHRSAAYTEQSGASQPPYPAHITFSGNVDSVSLCGNVYLPSFNPQNSTTSSSYDSVTMRPDYDYDVVPGSTLTNIAIADNPAPQNIDVCSPAAAPLLNCPNTTQPPQNNLPAANVLTGLALANYGSPSEAVAVAPGAATDSSGSTVITIPLTTNPIPGCEVNLAYQGANGLDVGTVAVNTTYYFFVISGPGGANPSCMASASLTPSFKNTGNTYKLSQTATTTNGSEIVFAVGGNLSTPTSNPLAGMAVGDLIKSTGYIQDMTPTTITSLQSFSLNRLSGSTSLGSSNVNFSAGTSLTGAASGMAVAGPQLTPGTLITAVNTGCGTTPCISISPAANGPVSSQSFWISGGYTITLSQAAIQSSTPTVTVNVYAGLYRMIGALRTVTTGTPNVVSFAQDDDTFYLTTPVADINNAAVGTTAASYALPSVPTGISVEALGRCVGSSVTAGNLITVFTPPSVPGTPANFPTVPGFAIKTISIGSAPAIYPYRLYTDTSTHIAAQANNTSTLNCMTDGWVWHRSQ